MKSIFNFSPMLKDQLVKDMIASMKAQDRLKTDALKMIKAAIMNYEVSGKDMKSTDEVVVGILQKAVKQRYEAAEGFKQGGNLAMAEKELQEAEIYKTYLPAQMSEAEVRTIVRQTIAELGAAGPQDMGKVMAAIMPKVKGKADGGMVNRLVKGALLK
jgi:uncharacterized protein YqeY